MLFEVIELSENNAVDQNNAVLRKVALYSSQLANFVEESRVIINDTVS